VISLVLTAVLGHCLKQQPRHIRVIELEESQREDCSYPGLGLVEVNLLWAGSWNQARRSLTLHWGP